MPTLNYSPVPSVLPATEAAPAFQNIHATANAFGAPQGQALEELGQRFEQAGNRLADVAIARQNIFNQVAADDASNNWQDATNKLLYGDPEKGDTGFYGKKGREAMEAYPGVRKQLDAMLQEHRSKLQNPMQQIRFDSETRRMRQYLMSETGRHYDRENNRWTESVYVGQAKQAQQSIAQAAATGDDDKFTDELNRGVQATIKAHMFAGKSEEEAKAAAGVFASTALQMKAESLMAESPVVARDFLKAHRDQFKDPGKYLELMGKVETKARDEVATDIVRNRPSKSAGLVRGGATEAAAEHYKTAISLGATPNEAALLTSAANVESNFNPTAKHDQEALAAKGLPPGYGMYGHNAERLAAMQKQYGPRPNFEQQIKFALDELRSRPEGARVNAAKTPEELTELQFEFERPVRGPGDAKRLATTREYMTNPPSGNAPVAKGDITMTEGDSIGVGFKNTGLAGNPVGGRNPQAVLDNIQQNVGRDPNYYRGKTVLLSSGTMNDPDRGMMDIVPRQIKTIQEAGGNVILAGADTGKFAGRNRQLEEIAKEAGVPFAGPLPTNNVHPGPQGYKDYAANARGLIAGTSAIKPAVPGNIDLNNRPIVKNADGSISTVRSMSFNEDGKEVLIPTVADDGSRILSTDEAIAQYRRTGQFLGKFNTPAQATAYAEQLHQAQARQYGKPQDTLVIPPPDARLGEAPDDAIPGLTGELQRIAKDPRSIADPKTGEAAIKKARAEANAAYSQQQHQRTIQEQTQQAQDKQLSRQYISRMTSNSPNYPTVDEVKADTRLSAATVENLVGFIQRDARPETDAKLSAANQRKLFARMDPEYTGEDKITSESQLAKEYIAGNLTRSDREELEKDLADIQDPAGKRFTRKINETLKAVEVKMVPMMAGLGREKAYQYDPDAGERVKRWKEAVSAKIAEYNTAGKNPYTLFQPGPKDHPNPDYVGGEAFLSAFRPTLADRVKDKTALPITDKPPDLTTQAGIKAAYDAGKITRDQATQELIRRGFAKPAITVAPPLIGDEPVLVAPPRPEVPFAR